MSWWIGNFLVLLGLAVSCPVGAFEYRNLEPGLDYAVADPAPGTTAKIHLLRIDLHQFEVRPIQAREFKATILPVKTMAEKAGALAALNANFFDPQGHPLGLIVRDGKVENPAHPVSWYAALLIRGNRAKIAKVSGKNAGDGVDQAVQAGPRLVVGGGTMKLKAESSPKSAVGIDRTGHVVFIVSQGDIEINSLAKFLADPAKKGGAGLSHALNLDGGSSTQFFAHVGKFELNLPAFSKVPVALGVFKKKS